jgi:nitrogenase molybdenum-iron protein alpha/beta subunit
VESVKVISPRSRVLTGVDFSDIHAEIKKVGVDVLVGSSNGRQISKKEKIPLVRVGLPNSDRVGVGRQLILGYEGAGRLLDALTNVLLDVGSIY